MLKSSSSSCSSSYSKNEVDEAVAKRIEDEHEDEYEDEPKDKLSLCTPQLWYETAEFLLLIKLADFQASGGTDTSYETSIF